MSKDPDWINQSVEMLKAAFEELTVERGETIKILGMTVYMDRENGKAVINIHGCGDSHSLILSSKSLQIVAKSNASYAKHPDGKSHTCGCIGFESDSACWFMWNCTSSRS